MSTYDNWRNPWHTFIADEDCDVELCPTHQPERCFCGSLIIPDDAEPCYGGGFHHKADDCAWRCHDCAAVFAEDARAEAGEAARKGDRGEVW